MNETIFYFFYGFARQSEFLDVIIVLAADILPYFVFILSLLFLVFRKAPLGDQVAKWGEWAEKARDVFVVFFSAFFAWFLAHALKLVFQTERPFNFFRDVTPLFYESGYAFPSGHAVFFSALAVALYFYGKKAGYIFGMFALIIGMARITAGVHFPIDILGGFALGTLVSILARHVYGYRMQK